MTQKIPVLWPHCPMPTLDPGLDRTFKDNVITTRDTPDLRKFRKTWYNDLKKREDDFAALVPDGDWIWTANDDCLHVDPRWHSQVRHAIMQGTDMDVYVPYYNRGSWGANIPGLDEPKWPGMWTNDLNLHVAFARHLADEHWGEVVDITDSPGQPPRPIDGVDLGLQGPCYAFSKRFLQQMGPSAGWRYYMEGSMHEAVKRAGSRVYLLKGVYVFHMCAYLMKTQRREFSEHDAWRDNELNEMGVTAEERDLHLEDMLEK